MAPVPELLKRVRAELSHDFPDNRPIRVSRAPGRLDVMGGIADYTGSLVCEMPLDRAAAVALQERDDRELQVFSFNLLDEHQPFTVRISLDALSRATADSLRHDLGEPGRRWSGYLIGCLFLLHEQGSVDLSNSSVRGLNLALLSNVPLGSGISSSAAIEVATMMNLIEHFGLRGGFDPIQVSALCQQVENRVVGAPCGIMDQVSSCAGKAGTLLRMVCQPHELQQDLELPTGIRVIGINSNVKHSVGGGMYGRTRCAAFMGHRIILEKMRQGGAAVGKELLGDPMKGYLANLDLEDYKRLFRRFLPEQMKGGEFLLQFGGTIDKATKVEPDVIYHVQDATDHHVWEAHRVREFAAYIEHANALAPNTAERSGTLDKAAHLMYASHVSYTDSAKLGAEECDLLVDLIRKNERAGFYGAKITGGGSGGTVAVLCNDDDKTDGAIAEIMRIYQQQTGNRPEAFTGTSLGAWHMGTALA